MLNKSSLKKIPRWIPAYYILMAFWFLSTALHIPDGYLSPATTTVMTILVLPFWIIGLKKLREKISAKTVSAVALFAAFSFVIMMFNVPLPGGTTGHAVGGALAAIILGPEIATIAISIALVIQAIFFGDGGILAIGANCFNLAVILPYVSYAIYQAFSRNQPLDSKRRILGSAVGGWAGLTIAAFVTAVQFGIQPAFWHAADGTPLYAPYPLSVAIPAMVIPHILVASVVEGLITALVVAYLIRANKPALEFVNKIETSSAPSNAPKWRTLWIGLAVLIVITPLGLLAPGTAWGEWGAEELTSLGFSFIPEGLEKLSGLWSAPMPDYEIPAIQNPTVAYILSAIIGIFIVVGLVWLFAKLVAIGRKPEPQKS